MSTPNDDKKDIELEEREKKMNEENKAHDKISNAENDETADKESEAFGKIKQDNIKEVKPKKIPTGGILMPGFFTRSKSKERCKDGDDEHTEGEDTELVDKEKDDSLMSQARIKLPNPFRKSKLINEDEGEKSGEPKEKKSLRIRLPLVSVFPKKKKESDQNLEKQTKAGLASMETLDDGDKSADGKQDEMKNVPLDDKKDAEKQEVEELSFMQKIKAYRLAISALLAFGLLMIILVAIVWPTGKDPINNLDDDKYVATATSCGIVEGIKDDGAFTFRGIPYARPPVGDLRFRAAQPLNDINYCWNGTFLAHNATETCLQIHSNGTTTGIEDCLTLDVVTPYVRYDSPLPVIVLIGAESFIGGSPGKMRPSPRYARSRDVLFVRPNFRMGVLGLLALDVLSKDAYPHTSGNYALSDIIEALRWVQYNIRHFGGDPKAVTLFGHQAGATLITALTTMRGAEKLFARAWATSGGSLYPSKPLSQSEADSRSFLLATGCEDVRCLRESDPEKLMNTIEDTWRKPQPDLPSVTEVPEDRHEWLVLDGKILQEHPETVWKSEEGLPVKLVIGTTAHAAASTKLLMKNKEWTRDLLSHHVRSSVFSKLNISEEALEMYPKTYKGLSRMISDVRTVCPLLSMTKNMHNATFYVVTQPRGEQNISDVDSDIDAILGRYEPKTPEQRRYVSAIQQFFYHFIWHGKVQTESPGNKLLIIGQDVLAARSYSHCDFWINKNISKYAQLD